MLLIPAGLLSAAGTHAQDFPDTQLAVTKALYVREDAAAERRAAERRRVEELDRRSQEQAAQLQQQAVAVQQLGAELRQVRDERQLADLAGEFDAAIAAGRWTVARVFLADNVTVGLTDAPAVVAADSFVAGLPALLGRSGVLPRANQRVAVEGDHATLTSSGFAWGGTDRAWRTGQFDYGFVRTPDGWKIDSLVFRPAALP